MKKKKVRSAGQLLTHRPLLTQSVTHLKTHTPKNTAALQVGSLSDKAFLQQDHMLFTHMLPFSLRVCSMNVLEYLHRLLQRQDCLLFFLQDES